MNIVELNEKNLTEALKVFKRIRAPYYEQTFKDCPDDDAIKDSFYGAGGDGITYVFTEKGSCNGLVTIDKSVAQIKNLSFDFSALADADLTKILEFTLKQFSAITLVFIWVSSLETEVIDLLENYGFEYTGEQDYIDKERFISNYKYVFRRKK